MLDALPPTVAAHAEFVICDCAIENRVHYVRDVTMGEDAHQIRSGNAPQMLAALRNSIIGLIRNKGWTNIADALRHYGASAHCALMLIASPL